MEQKSLTVLKQIQLSSHRCSVPFHMALFDGVICVFRAQNNKSNDLYLLVLAQVTEEREAQYSKRLEAVRSVWAWLMKFKDIWSVSGIDVEILYRIPMMLRQQQTWKFSSAIRNVGTLRFCKL